MEPSNEQKLSQLKEMLLEKQKSNVRIQKEITFLKNDESFRKYLIELYKIPDNIHQILYTIMNCKESSICNCGNTKKFVSYSKGYLETCGNKKCIDEKRTLELKKNTLLKYGVDHPTKLQATKDKYKKTMMSKYGVSHNWKGRLREKGEATMLDKYGTKHALQNDEIKNKRNNTTLERHGTLNMLGLEKTKRTNLEKYGFENAARSKVIIDKIRKSEQITAYKLAKTKLLNYNIEFISYEDGYYLLKCSKCGNTFKKCGSGVNRELRIEIDPCPFCNNQKPDNKRYSKTEKEIADYVIKSSGNTGVLTNVRSIIKNRELDIYIPDLNIAIEFNGTYWHSELEKPKTYHFDKTSDALKSRIKLYHIWEDDWNSKNEIVKSMILNWIRKTPNKIFARNCEVRVINNKEYSAFCKSNHLKKSKPSTISYGLFYNETLVSIMSFTKKKKYWELDRFCNLLNHNVIGGASKLFKKFIKDYDPAKVISYCDIDITPDPDKSVYVKLGFKLVEKTSSYSWVVNGIRLNRTNFMKHKLVKEGYSSELTEVEIMQNRGYYRTFECGNWKFEYENLNNKIV